MRNLEFCDRCLPEKSITAMGYIPLPEMTNIGDTRVDERKILLCRTHYFEAKENCYYVIPFNRDDDPVDSFLTKVNQKHRRIRGRTKRKPPEIKELEEPLDPVILENFPKPRRIRNTNEKGVPKRIEFRKDVDPASEKPKLLAPRNGDSKRTVKIHFREANQTACGLRGITPNTLATTNIDALTCKHCIAILNQEPIQV